MSGDINVLALEMRPFIKRSVATGPGNVGGTTLVDATLVEAANFWNDCWVLLRTGDYAGELRRVTASVPGTLTLDHGVGGMIVAAVQYVMLAALPVTVVAGGGLKADLRQVLGQGADLSPANPMLVDVVDAAGRLVGIVYGSQDQLQQVPGTLELITQDTGLNTNPERWLHDNHWSCEEVTINAVGVGGQQNLGGAVPAGLTRRIREITIRHEGSADTVVTLLISGGATKLSLKISSKSTVVWPGGDSKDGRDFAAAEQPAVQSSDVTDGNTYVSASGVEA